MLGGTGDGQIKVLADGTITWLSGDTYKSACIFDVTYFPFDVQKCKQNFMPWPANADKVMLRHQELNYNSTTRMKYYVEHSEWHLESVELESRVNDGEGYSQSEIEVTFTLRRKHQYYVNSVCIPCAMLAFLILLVFALPADAGEKIGFGITVLLTFSVFQLMIANSLPKTSDTTPLIGE